MEDEIKTEESIVVECAGEMSLKEANHANIPVNIFIQKASKEDTDKWQYEMWADNFMPRKSTCSQGAYHYYANDKAHLAELAKKYILPLYTTAFALATDLSDGKVDDLYYWEK